MLKSSFLYSKNSFDVRISMHNNETIDQEATLKTIMVEPA